jgi:hypothetical protein
MRSIGMFQACTTTLGSNTACRDSSFSSERAMTVAKAEQNRIPKCGVMDSSQRTALRISSLANRRTQYATINKNDVVSALTRTRNLGCVAPKKKGAIQHTTYIYAH